MLKKKAIWVGQTFFFSISKPKYSVPNKVEVHYFDSVEFEKLLSTQQSLNVFKYSSYKCFLCNVQFCSNNVYIAEVVCASGLCVFGQKMILYNV